jgi:hypothetical protein
MCKQSWQLGNRRRKPSAILVAGILAASAFLGSSPAGANGLGENGSWQFQTSQDKVNKGAIVDLMERKKGGYYDSFSTTINNTTYIDKQFNCGVTANAAGNSGSNGISAHTSSPTVGNSASTSANTSANDATNGLAQLGIGGVLTVNPLVPTPTNGVTNGQSNTGSLNSGVSGSSTSGVTGAVDANGGSTQQGLNSNQSNTGTLTAQVTGSTACAGPLVGGPLN